LNVHKFDGFNVREVSYIVHDKSVTNTFWVHPCGRFHQSDVASDAINQGMPMCGRRNMGQHTFVPSFRVGLLGQPTMSLPDFAVGQWTFEAYA
jgi:hypothetical protein